MDAPCEIQRSIHVFRLVNNMCPGKWVHIREASLYLCIFVYYNTLTPFKEYAVFLGCSTWKSSTTGVSELIPGAW